MNQMKHKSTLYQRWATNLVRLYPAAWRERYGEEMLLILEASSPTLMTLLNLFINLFDAHLHRNLVTGRTPHMFEKMRSHELTIFGSTIIFLFVWIVAGVRLPGPHALIVFPSFNASPSIVNSIHIISLFLLALILLGGLPILLAAGWRALRTRNFLALFLCLLGFISPFVALILTILFISFLSGVLNIWSGSAYIIVTTLVGCICMGLSVTFIVFAVQRVIPSRRITQYAFYLATLIPLVMLIGLVLLSIGIFPYLISVDPSYLIRQGILDLIMVATLVFSLYSLKNSFQARRIARNTP
jgi:hypothetical protein